MVSAASHDTIPPGLELAHRKFSTVVPAESSGEGRPVRLDDLDLALRLHRLRLVFFFSGPAGSVPTPDLKLPFFPLLKPFFPSCARVRVSGSGRPFLHCNDCGVRIVETRSESPMDRWLDTHAPLAPDVVLGSDVNFSPLVAIQFTRFSCGGLAVGLSWAHALGDAAAAANFAAAYFRMLNGNPPPDPITLRKPAAALPPLASPPQSVKPGKTVTGSWLAAPEDTMETLTFRVGGEAVAALAAEAAAGTPFAAVSAAVWRSLARIRGSAAVTVVRFGGAAREWILGNDLTVGVAAPPADFSLAELARVISRETADETAAIAALAAAEAAPPDLVMYGANLTFVDLEELPVYAAGIGGQLPAFVGCTVDGVGGGGCVVVLKGAAGSDGGRTVHVTVPQAEAAPLRTELLPVFGLL
ncbi:protein ECERIFERUM 2-like [Wolffia australiana]